MPVDVEEYANFIRSVQIVNTYVDRLNSENVKDLSAFYNADHREYKIDHSFRARLLEEIVTSPQPYNLIGEGRYSVNVRIGNPEEFQLFCVLTVNLVAQYLVSAKDIASPVIDQFAQMNLPVNLWPYAREVVSNVTMRMGITPVIF
jgi:preprotein translocase subunit SecB